MLIDTFVCVGRGAAPPKDSTSRFLGRNTHTGACRQLFSLGVLLMYLCVRGGAKRKLLTRIVHQHPE